MSNVTVGGHKCQPWADQSPTNTLRVANARRDELAGHETFKVMIKGGLNGETAEEVRMPHNFCRNPRSDSFGPWCYTQSSSLRWERCNTNEYTSGGETSTFWQPEGCIVDHETNKIYWNTSGRNCSVGANSTQCVWQDKVRKFDTGCSEQFPCVKMAASKFKVTGQGRCKVSEKALSAERNPGKKYHTRLDFCAEECRDRMAPGFSMNKNGDCYCDSAIDCGGMQDTSSYWHFDLSPTLVAKGANPDTRFRGLQLCEGTCKTNNDCEGDMVCHKTTGTNPIPGCKGTPQKATATA